MKKHWKQILFLLVVAVMAALLVWLKQTDFFTFENLKKHREFLKAYVDGHYVISAAGVVLVYLSTAFFIPGAIVFTLAAGFLFGTLPGPSM